MNNLGEEKYYKIPKANKSFVEKVLKSEKAFELLCVVGFTEVTINEVKFMLLKMPLDEVDAEFVYFFFFFELFVFL